MHFWNKCNLLLLLLLFGCSEQQTFDNSFKLTLKQSFLSYCDTRDLNCQESVNLHLDNCIDQFDYNTDELYHIFNTDDLSQPKHNLSEDELKTVISFGKSLENCMVQNIGGEYAKNIKHGIEKNIKITQPTINQKSSSSLLVAIKENGDIWINKDKVTLKSLKSFAKSHFKKNPQTYAVIIADKNASTSDLVTVMDQLKSAGINDIKLSSTKK